MAGSAVPLDPHVVLNEILEKLTRLTEAAESIAEDMGMAADVVEAVDGALGETYDKNEKLTPAGFLRLYGQIRDQQAEEEGPDDDEPGSMPGPGAAE